MPLAKATSSPSRERLLRTIFLTVWMLTVTLSALGFATELIGVRWLPASDADPKLHMTDEAYLARRMSTFTAVALGLACFLVRRSSRRLLAGIVALLIGFAYIGLPRY